MGKKIEGVRFWCRSGFSFGKMPEYVLCMDGKCHKEIWVHIGLFKSGERKFGYEQHPSAHEYVKLSPKQEARVATYLREYELARGSYFRFEEFLIHMEVTLGRAKEECPTLYEEYAEKVAGKLDGLQRRLNGRNANAEI